LQINAIFNENPLDVVEGERYRCYVKFEIKYIEQSSLERFDLDRFSRLKGLGNYVGT